MFLLEVVHRLLLDESPCVTQIAELLPGVESVVDFAVSAATVCGVW